MVITRFQVSLSLSVDFVPPTSSFLNVKLAPEEDHMLNCGLYSIHFHTGLGMFYKQGFTDREYKIEHVKPQRIHEAF